MLAGGIVGEYGVGSNEGGPVYRIRKFLSMLGFGAIEIASRA